MRTAPFLPLLVATALVVACVPVLPTTPKGDRPKATNPSGLDADAGTPTAAAYTGRVLGLTGQPAVGVEIKSYIIAAGGGNLIGHAGGNLIGHAGGNIIAAGGGNYRVLASSAKTDEEGRFTLDLPATAAVNIEAIQAEDVKAIQLEVKQEAGPIQLQLAKTGSITGKVTAPGAASVTDFTGVDVFIPGTGYVAKTDASGHFTLPNVPVGTFALFAMKSGLGTALVQNVKVESEKTTAAPGLPLTIEAPVIATLSPDVAGPEVEVTITGENFGATEGRTFQVTVGGTKVTAPKRVDDQTIMIKIPTSAGSGDVVVEVDGIPSAGEPFKVLKTLKLDHNHLELIKGKHYAFSAKGLDTAGATVEGPPVTWNVTEGSAIDLDASGKVTAKALGAATLTVSSGNLSSEPFTVEVVPTLYQVSTFVGSGTMGSRDGTGTAADLGVATHMVMDSQGNLFVLDTPTSTPPYRLRKVTPEGVVSTFLGTGTLMSSIPQGMTIDGDDNLYLSAVNNRIYKVTPEKTVSIYTGSGSTDSVDGALDPEGAATPASFLFPGPLASDGGGVLYVAEVPSVGEYSKIRKLSAPDVTTLSDGITWTDSAPEPVHITAMTRDDAGNMFWVARATSSAYVLYKLTPDGTPSVLAGGGAGPALDGTGSDAVFGQVRGLAVDGEGNVLVSEFHTQSSGTEKAQHLLRRVTPAGVVTTLSGGDYGFQDGRGKVARFETPRDVVVTSTGVIYLLDSSNHRIRKLTPLTE